MTDDSFVGVGSIPLPAVPTFEVGEYFKTGSESAKREVAICLLWFCDSMQWIFDYVESKTSCWQYNVRQLKERVPHETLLASLGITRGATFGQLYHVLWEQGNGEEPGVFHVDGRENVAFVSGMDGEILLVTFYWLEAQKGWVITIRPVSERRPPLEVGTRVLTVEVE